MSLKNKAARMSGAGGGIGHAIGVRFTTEVPESCSDD